MVPPSTLATMPGDLLSAGFDPQPVLVVVIVSLAPFLWGLVSLAVALLVAPARRPASGVKAVSAEAPGFQPAA